MTRARKWGIVLVVAGIVTLGGLRLLDVYAPDLSRWQPPERGVPARDADDRPDAFVDVRSSTRVPWAWVTPRATTANRTAAPFEQNDWGAAWLNTLEQAFGNAVAVAAEDLAAPDARLDDFEVLVLSPEAVDAIEAAILIPRLEAWTRAGGVLVLDRPTLAMQRLSGVQCSTEEVPATRFTSWRGIQGVDAWWQSCPTPTRRSAAVTMDDDVLVVAELDLTPVVLERPLGAGLVQTIAFDYPQWLVAMQQGTPADEEYGVTKRFGRYDWLLEPEDIVCDERLLDNPIPYADALEDALVEGWCATAPRARWWRFPQTWRGAFLMTHDEDLQGGAASAFLTEHEREIGATSTHFLILNRRLWETWYESEDWFAWFEQRDADLQLHWNVLPMPIGFWKIEPFRVRYSMTQQHALLSKHVGRPIANRTHYLIIGDHYTRAFRVLHEYGIRWDTTYGPNRGGRGYLFGTGLPYRPLDTDGTPFPLWEIPFVTQEDWGDASPQFLAKLLDESKAVYHQMIIPIFHPHLITLEPEGEAFWKGSYEAARAANHGITNFREWDMFWSDRRASRCRSVFTNETLEVRFDARSDGLSLQIPERVRDHEHRVSTLISIAVDGVRVDGERIATVGGACRLVPVLRGEGRLVARYATP